MRKKERKAITRRRVTKVNMKRRKDTKKSTKMKVATTKRRRKVKKVKKGTNTTRKAALRRGIQPKENMKCTN